MFWPYTTTDLRSGSNRSRRGRAVAEIGCGRGIGRVCREGTCMSSESLDLGDDQKRHASAGDRIQGPLPRALVEKSAQTRQARLPVVVPRDHTAGTAALDGILRVGSRVLVRMGAIHEEEIDRAMEWREVERRAVAGQTADLLRFVHAVEAVSIVRRPLADVRAVNERK